MAVGLTHDPIIQMGFDENKLPSGYYRSDGAGGTPNIPSFNFDWAAAEKTAFEKLRPYYEQKLKEAGGDVELAKKRIEEDYTTGNRYRSEDTATAERAAATNIGRINEDAARGERLRAEDLALELGSDATLAKKETYDTRADANSRGVLFGENTQDRSGTPAEYSGFANTYIMQPLSERQALRKQAIQRAIARQSEVAGIEKERGIQDENTSLDKIKNTLTRQGETATTTKNRGIQDEDVALKKQQDALKEEQTNRATYDLPQLEYNKQYTNYQAAVNKSLQPYS